MCIRLRLPLIVGAIVIGLAALPAAATSMRRVINATGIVVHTNLGRAPLSPAALDAVGLDEDERALRHAW